jgi:hypothetical protein
MSLAFVPNAGPQALVEYFEENQGRKWLLSQIELLTKPTSDLREPRLALIRNLRPLTD